MQWLFNVRYGKNWIYISLRLVMLVAFSIALYFLSPPDTAALTIDLATVTTLDYIVYPAAVGIVGALVVGVFALVLPLRVYAPLAIMPADWALVGAYIYYGTYEAPFLMALITGTIAVSGILRLGSQLGMIHAGGIFISALVALASVPAIGIDTLTTTPMSYVPPAVLTLLMVILALVWYNSLDEENHRQRKEVRREIKTTRSRLDDMRERTKAFAEMATTLNSTLNYDKILDAAMDIGRLSIRHDPKERVISMALMVINDEELEIATARGIPHNDLNHVFPGEEGIIAEALEEGYPIVHTTRDRDPELRHIRAFKGIQTTLCVPLRSNYETYGALIFGSTVEDAINEDHIDTLAAIGTQTAIALQNAVLYGDLRDEKERLIRIEENGRKALVRDLHDIPTQTISAVAMQLSVIPMVADRKPDQLRDEIEKIRQMALRASEEIRHVMFTLRPLALETQGLGAALHQLTEKMKKTYNQPMTVNIDDRVQQLLEQNEQGTLFYLIEEAANNARKYAEADLIKVQVGIQDYSIVVRVQDNGKGFNTGLVGDNYEQRGSFGMVNMQERAELINGEFSLDSTPGQGTTVTVRIPVDKRQLRRLNRATGRGNERPTDPPSGARTKARKSLRGKSRQYSGPLSPST